MSKALSLDLRVRVLAAVEAGASHREAGERFGVSAASVSRWRRLAREQGAPRPPMRRRLRGSSSAISNASLRCHGLQGSPDRRGATRRAPPARPVGRRSPLSPHRGARARDPGSHRRQARHHARGDQGRIGGARRPGRDRHGVAVLPAPRHHAQKKSAHAAEQSRPDVLRRRAEQSRPDVLRRRLLRDKTRPPGKPPVAVSRR
jgi:transposase-like protein